MPFGLSGLSALLPNLFSPKTYYALLLLPGLLRSLSKVKHAPDTKSTFKSEYDFIVVGAGSGGATVAARLSEYPCINVLLLEAGTATPTLNEVPAFARNFWNTAIDWQYKTVPQNHTGTGLNKRQIIWPSGKALGGSSSLNAMLYVRGNKKNYDDWEKMGAKGWSYKEVLPYFLKMEDNRDPDYVANGFHSTGGPLTVEKSRYHSEIKDPIIEAFKELGYKVVDPNGEKQTGIYDLEATMRNGQRCSTAKAYLVPADQRSNFDIVDSAFVRKVIIENGKAVGVEFDHKRKKHTVKANKEVILSAGTINSAQLLMLSGIGPKEHLDQLKIPVFADLPVGNNLQDHCATFMNFQLRSKIPDAFTKILSPHNIKEYKNHRRGPLSSPEFISLMAFLRGTEVDPKEDDPTFELYFAEGAKALPAKYQFGLTSKVFKKVYGPYKRRGYYLCLSQILQPKSRGTVRLKSKNPHDPPLIDPNYFAEPEDVQAVVDGMKVCQKIGTSESIKKVGGKPFTALWPGCEEFADDEDKLFSCQARSAVVTLSHQVGTAKMGDPSDNTTVVDPQLRVKGIEGLRVVDASIMPIVPSGNTNVPTIMVGEKAADIIKASLNCTTNR